MSQKNGKSRMCFNLDSDIAKRLRDMSKKTGISQTFLFRKAIEEMLSRREA